MSLPGFSAEASLSMIAGSCGNRSDRSRHTRSRMSRVEAALAIYVDGLYYCDGEITGGGISCYQTNAGGGGRPDPGDLACRRCLANCNRKPVSQRPACRQRCQDIVC